MFCFYCNCEIFPGAKKPLVPPKISIIDKLLPKPEIKFKYPLATRDHRVPRCMTKGQPNDNTVPSCEACNVDKRTLTVEEYRVLKAFRYGYVSGVEYTFPGEDLLAIANLPV